MKTTSPFVTKDDLKESLNDMRVQIIDAIDGKLKSQEIRFDEKLAKQTDDIVKDVAKTIMPLIDDHEIRIATLEKQRPRIPS